MPAGRLESWFARYREHADLDALGRVFDEVAPELAKVARHLSPDEAAAEDLLQATFLAAIEHAERFDPERELVPWLVGILTNKARLAQALRARPLDRTRVVAPAEADPALDAECAEFVAALDAALARIPAKYREVLQRRLFLGEKPEDIARELRRGPGAVRVQLHRGLSLLRRVLPSSFAFALVASTQRRGLAAVREGVLRHARLAPHVAAAGVPAVIGGAIVSTKVIAACAALVLVLAAGWLALSRSRAAEPRSVAKEQAPISAPSVAALEPSVAPDASERSSVAVDAPAPVASSLPAPAAPYGALDLLVLWDDRTPAAGVELEALPHGERQPPQARQFVTTGADGRASLETIHAGVVDLYSDHSNALGMHESVGTVDCIAAQRTQRTIVLVRGYDVSGRVVDQDGNAVAGATIWYGHETATVSLPIATSAADGTFSVRSLQAEGHLMAAADGLGTSQVAVFPEEHPRGLLSPLFGRLQPPERRVEGMVLTLDGSTGRIEGTVRDENGEPVSGARVAWMVRYVLRGSERVSQMPVSTASASDGTFQLAGLREATAQLVVAAPGYALWKEGLCKVTRDATTRIEAVLSRGAVVYGSVSNPAGKPLAGARVEGKYGESMWPDFADLWTTSDAEGRFRLERIRSGSFELSISAPEAVGERKLTRVFEAQAGEQREWNASFGPALSIAGRAIDPSGKPLVGWIVKAFPNEENTGQQQSEAICDKDGLFELRELDGGPHRVELHAPPPRHGATSEMVLRKRDVQPGVEDLVLVGDLDDLPSAYVHGRVVDSLGNALPGVAVHAFSNHIGDSTRTSTTGTFRIGPLRRGEAEVWVEPAQRPRIVFKSTNVAAREDRDLGDLTIPDCGRLQLALRRDDGTELLEPVCYLLQDDDLRSKFVAEAGEWLSGEVYAGKYELVAHARNSLESRTEVEVLAGSTARVELSLRAASERRVDLIAADGEPLRELHVRATDEHGALVLDHAWHDKSANISPRFPFPFGRIHLEAEADGGRRATIDFEHRPGLDVEDAIRLELVAGR